MSRYELLERIGAGGMAEIFRAKAVAAGGFEKPVAIKRILPHLSQDERFVELLITEAKTLSRLRHRNIVQIFDVGMAEDGQYFLVMEYVDGTDLGALFEFLEKRGRRLPLDVALHIGAEVCEALAHAHRATDADGNSIRLVHRDVSPSNVLLSRSGEVKLTDFGIAKSIEEATGHGGVRGKFAYISPEQSMNERVDARSDAYSLAIVMHELIAGRRLFSGMADFDALAAVRHPRIPRLRTIEASVPAELDDIIAKALSPRPDDRYENAAAFGSALRTFRYSMDETSGDPAKSISLLVRDVGNQWEEDDDERTVLRQVSPDEDLGAPGGFGFDDEVTRAVSFLGPQKASVTLSTKAILPREPGEASGPIRQPSSSGVPSQVGTSSSAAQTRRLGRDAGFDELPTQSLDRSHALAARAGTGQPAGNDQANVAPGGTVEGPGSARLGTPTASVSRRAPNRFPTPHPEAPVAPVPRSQTAAPRASSWRMVLVLAAVAAVIAVIAFVLAGRVLMDMKDSAGATAADAGVAVVFDGGAAPAGAFDGGAAAAAPTDARAAAPIVPALDASVVDARPAKKKRKRRSRKKRKRRSRKKRRR